MLQRIESHAGLVILATNMKANIDPLCRATNTSEKEKDYYFRRFGSGNKKRV